MLLLEAKKKIIKKKNEKTGTLLSEINNICPTMSV